MVTTVRVARSPVYVLSGEIGTATRYEMFSDRMIAFHGFLPSPLGRRLLPEICGKGEGVLELYLDTGLAEFLPCDRSNLPMFINPRWRVMS